MPNISTNNTNSIYKYTAHIKTTTSGDDTPIDIDNIRFKSVICDYNYREFAFPLIYVIVNIRIEDIHKFADYQKTGTLVFTLQKYMENSSDMSSLREDVINEEFVYFIDGDIGKTDEHEAVLDQEKTDDRGLDITIGLIATRLLNANKNIQVGTIKKGSMSSIVCKMLDFQDLCIEPFDNNTVLEDFTIPYRSSLKKVIGYFDTYSTFYNTPYVFFMDFNRSYLLSSNGRGVPIKGEPINMVKFIIDNVYDEANMEGMRMQEEQDKMYIVDVSSSYVTLMTAADSSRSFSSIKGIGSAGESVDVETGIRDEASPIKEMSTPIRVPNNNTRLIDNKAIELANAAKGINIIKNKIDTSILTPNKQYYIDPGEAFDEDSCKGGFYLLKRKREVYLPEGEGLAMSVHLSFDYLANQPA